MITYCTNIHPGESWDEICAQVKTHCLSVKKAISPHEPFPIGLRLSNRAACEMDERGARQFHEWCQANGCFVPTINGFPFGSFHAAPIKERVYLPDWRSPERVAYTKRLADLLDLWLPQGLTGSISTVPVGFWNSEFRIRNSEFRSNIIQVLEHLHRLREKSGKKIILALEPEPGCILETTDDVVRFFEQMAFPEGLREGIGICLDCCHQAVQFEKPARSMQLLADAGIDIGKIQISSALCLRAPGRKELETLLEPVYLHQVVIRKPDNRLLRYRDLPDALCNYRDCAADEWRIHFHLPIFLDETDRYATTQAYILELLPVLPADILLEVETYTWNVLPEGLRLNNMTDSIIREIEWVRKSVANSGARIQESEVEAILNPDS